MLLHLKCRSLPQKHTACLNASTPLRLRPGASRGEWGCSWAWTWGWAWGFGGASSSFGHFISLWPGQKWKRRCRIINGQFGSWSVELSGAVAGTEAIAEASENALKDMDSSLPLLMTLSHAHPQEFFPVGCRWCGYRLLGPNPWLAIKLFCNNFLAPATFFGSLSPPPPPSISVFLPIYA